MAERVLRRPGFSRRLDLAPWRRVLVVVLVLLAVAAGSLATGKVPLGREQLLALFEGAHTSVRIIVLELRLPRLVLGALVGGLLALSGWLFQQIMRNALASPDILGVTSGASAAAVSYLAWLAVPLGAWGVPFAAMIGAVGAAGLIYALAWSRGVTPIRLVLTGIGVSAALGAVTTFVLAFSPLTTTLSAYVWLTGSVYGANWHDVGTLTLWAVVLILPLAIKMRFAVLAALDDALATGLGVRVQRQRAMLLALAAAMAGVAIAAGGAFAFVGLIAPHLARRVSRAVGASQAVLSVLWGALLVVSADWIARTVFLPLDLPAGIFVAALGAPFFLWLLLREAR
ncbi:FecCD family ABC transporter permease [Larsenimonas suaedae]|uniref:Iron ABC transporter permease n=1 Tax=Larsenimonas suaedae TaxID=1851019 RepID=A0ABU1GRL5_9GAMM|nr:iron ABC transporter permease [Larsenimonas suaedae]MCM2972533.1 iron ABC transporter permease [Larsenimonas suaedae]MDR5894671.1 iron ABC transporter permease [Larsenimonas suaedae]